MAATLRWSSGTSHSTEMGQSGEHQSSDCGKTAPSYALGDNNFLSSEKCFYLYALRTRDETLFQSQRVSPQGSS
jgi:hypothetical protein